MLNVLILFGLTVVASAAEAGINRNKYRPETAGSGAVT